MVRLAHIPARILVVGAFFALSGCPGVGDIDRTQPEKVKKSIFFEADGTTPAQYFFRQTIVDVPATNGVTFIGNQGDTERVVFEITEGFLFAHRAYGWLENEGEQGALEGNQGDGYVRPGTGPYQGAPIAAFAITSHFDVKRQYNPQTGEQTNVIVEDTQDRPWYEREFIRVDWSENLIADFRFDSATVLQTPASISVPEEGGSDGDHDRPQISADYIDVVTKLNVEPENIDFSAYGYGKIPECYFYSSIYKDCLGGTIKVRNSFMRIGERDYLPLDYDDRRMLKFGFFRSERYRVNDEYGTVEPAQVRLANRWNLWKDAASCYDADADLPYGACRPSQLRTIVYYLNEDFPHEPAALREIALDNADEWNRVLREAVKASTGFTDDDLGDHRMFTLCVNNPVQKDDPEECGAVGTNPQIGDLRYSMYYYVPNVQDAPPLGYGPSAADPLTGEIIQGNAFYYGAAGATIAARTRDIVKLSLGLLEEDDIIDGIPASDAVAAARAALSSSQTRNFGDQVGEKARALADNLRIPDHGRRLRELVASGQALHDKRSARQVALQQSGIAQLLVSDEMREVFGPHLLEEGVVDPNTAIAARLFDDELLFRRERLRQDRLLTPAARGCILHAEDVFDDGLLGLTARVRNKFYDPVTLTLKNGYTDADVYEFILASTMGDTQLHEIGHTMGLRHNFAGSTDALNFGENYWDLRGLVRTAGAPRPVPQWEIGAGLQGAFETALEDGMRDNQDSSVMDYASTYGTNLSLGTYDLAAIKYAYGDVVEIFDTPDITPERAALLRQGELHYTYYPEVVSDAPTYEERVAALHARHELNFRKVPALKDAQTGDPIEVPYTFCSDEYRDASAVCAIWDQGADNFERTIYATEHYRSYVLFNNFKRERLTFGLDIFGYLGRIYTRDYTYMLNQYKNWVNDELILRSDRPCLAMEDGQIVNASDDRFAADACGLAGFLGTVETVNLIAEVLESPDIGCYARLEPGCYDTVVGNGSTSAPPDDADIELVSADPDDCDSYVPVQPADEDASRRIALKVTATSPYTHVRDSTSCEGFQPLGFMEEPVELGFATNGARPANTLYDRDRYGYYFYIKPIVMGSWWEKWLAIKALGDSNTDFIGVDASSDTRSFLISLNTLFGDDINTVIGGAITDNVGRYGPVLSAGGALQNVPLLDINTGGAVDREQLGLPTINPDQQYTFRLLAMFNAAYNGQATDDFEFGESLAVGHAFAITDTDVPASVRSDPARYAELTDPVTGLKWFALNQRRTDDGTFYAVAYNFVREIKDRYYVGGADGPGTQLLPGFEGSFLFEPRQDIEILRIMESTTRAFGYADVWSADPSF